MSGDTVYGDAMLLFIAFLVVALINRATELLMHIIFAMLRRKLRRETIGIELYDPLIKPNTLEEAKAIILRSREDDYGILYRQALRINPWVSLAIWAVCIIAIDLYVAARGGERGAMLKLFWLAAVLWFPLIMASLSFDKGTQNMRSGVYFQEQTEERLMQLAEEYVGDYNRFEESLGRKPAEPGTLPEGSWKSPWLSKIKATEMTSMNKEMDHAAEFCTQRYYAYARGRHR